MSAYVSALCAALVVAAPVVAAGQSLMSPAATTETIKAFIEQPVPDQDKPAGSTFTAGWRDGFFIQNDNGDFRLQLGLLLHADARFSLKDTAETAIDTFAVRRLRPYIRGRLFQRFEFYVNPDFAGGTLVLQDAYVDTRFSNAFRVRLGKSKAPFGHERLQSVAYILFFERGTPTSIAPNRDLGVQVFGDVGGGVFSYQGAVMNGSPDGGSADLDTNDGKDLIGRVATRPFARNAKSPLAGLGFALSGTWGKQAGLAALPVVRTPTVGQTFFSYTGSVADGTRTRYSPFVSYYNKGFAGWWEYAHSELPVRKGSLSEDIGSEAWQIVGSYVLTGENASDSGVRPKNNFDFGNGHWGAFQVAARYFKFAADEAAISLGFATPGSSREMNGWTIGLNWYLSPYLKSVINYERIVFDDDPHGPRPVENGLGIRMQIAF